MVSMTCCGSTVFGCPDHTIAIPPGWRATLKLSAAMPPTERYQGCSTPAGFSLTVGDGIWIRAKGIVAGGVRSQRFCAHVDSHAPQIGVNEIQSIAAGQRIACRLIIPGSRNSTLDSTERVQFIEHSPAKALSKHPDCGYSLHLDRGARNVGQISVLHLVDCQASPTHKSGVLNWDRDALVAGAPGYPWPVPGWILRMGQATCQQAKEE